MEFDFSEKTEQEKQEEFAEDMGKLIAKMHCLTLFETKKKMLSIAQISFIISTIVRVVLLVVVWYFFPDFHMEYKTIINVVFYVSLGFDLIKQLLIIKFL